MSSAIRRGFALMCIVVGTAVAACAHVTPETPVVLSGEGVISEAKPPIERVAKVVGKADAVQCRFERIEDWQPHVVNGKTLWTPVILRSVGGCP